jgi:hypothetical protein
MIPVPADALVRVPLDVEAIAARAEAAPGGYWVAFSDSVWIPWEADDDLDPEAAWDHGRYVAIQDDGWHGTAEPPEQLWAFLANARDDVLSLAAEVRRLNAALAATPAQALEHLAQQIYEAACSARCASYEIMTQPSWETLDPVHRACWQAAATEARRAGSPVTIWRHAATLTAWLDAANPRTDHEVACRVMKLAEETGEAISAYIGMVGQNPRKGTCATLDDLAAELCDVIVTAMVALATVTGDAAGAETRMQQHLSARFTRLLARTGTAPATPPGAV